MNDLHPIHDEGLSPAAEAALAALRADDGEMPATARDRVWTRLERGPIAAAPVRVPWRGVVIGLAIAAGLVLALASLGRGAQPIARAPRGEAARYDGAAATGELAARDGGPPTGERAAVVAAPATASVPETAVPEDRSVRAVPEDRSSRAVPEDRPRRAAAAEDASQAADASTLAAEAALLQRAQTALAAGDPEAALVRLGEHARGYRDGVLARERDALRVTALCAAGRTDEGRAEGEAFLRAHAGSLLAERVRGACAP